MKRYISFIIALLFSAIITAGVNAQAGYNISLSCNQLQKQTVKLAYHLGPSQYLKDSLITDISGKCTFKGKEKLAPGVYMIVFPGNKYFEFLVEDDQTFNISCSYKPVPVKDSKQKTSDSKWKNYEITGIKFSGSALNENFLNYQSAWQSLQQKDSELKKEYEKAKGNTGRQEEIKKSITDQESRMKSWLATQSGKYKGTLLGAIIKSIIPVDISIKDIPPSAANPDSVKRFWSYLYYKNHFFDNTELTNPGLIRSPVLATKLEQFFSEVVIQSPDSINKETDLLLRKCRSQKEVYQYVTSWIFNKYAASQYMGHDAVIVHIADSVYLAGKAPWVSSEFISDMAKKVNRLRPNLIGKKATDLVMSSFSGNFVALFDIKAEFTILYFWEPDCGHCKESTPKLKEFYDNNRGKGIEVFAVCTKDNKELWEKYIIDHHLTWTNGWDPERLSHFDYFYNVESTPLVYILDKDKKIIAKRISVEEIGPFIDSYKEYQNSLGFRVSR